MPYFSYHGRNKNLIKKNLLMDYFYENRGNECFLILVFKDGRQFPIKEERWMDYEQLIHQYYKGGIESEKGN